MQTTQTDHDAHADAHADTEAPADRQTTEFAQMLARHPIESAAHEALLAQVLAQVACADERTPTLAERAYISRFTPRIETPLATLAAQELPRGGLDDLGENRATTIMAIAYVVAMLDAQRAVDSAILSRLSARLGLPYARRAAAERVAREHVVEQRLARLYAYGEPTAPERAAAFKSLRAIGASDSLLTKWDARAKARAAARPDADGPDTTLDPQRRARFMARHDPTSTNHRVSSAIGVFGSR